MLLSPWRRRCRPKPCNFKLCKARGSLALKLLGGLHANYALHPRDLPVTCARDLMVLAPLVCRGTRTATSMGLLVLARHRDCNFMCEVGAEIRDLRSQPQQGRTGSYFFQHGLLWKPFGSFWDCLNRLQVKGGLSFKNLGWERLVWY